MNLEIAILEILECVEPLPMAESIIIADVKNTQVTEPTDDEVRRKLRNLEKKRQIRGRSNEDTGTKWQITTDGVFRLSEYRR